jgi:cysteine desulfurase
MCYAFIMKTPIYLDYMSTTPVDTRVKEQMLNYLSVNDNFGNPSSEHYYGLTAREAVEKARAEVANLINAKHEEIIWTSSATEANNLAIKGAASFYKRKGKHIITYKAEHKSVLAPCRYLENQGFDVTYLTPEKNGLIDLNKLEHAIREDTILISIMYVNNEIGVIQDIKAIGELIKPRGIVFHVDAVQAAGKIPIDLEAMQVDLMSFSAHKVYGPKGIGALYIKHKPRIRLEPQMHGSGQEFGMRSGTLATHQIVGMGTAFSIAQQEMEQNNARIYQLREQLWNGIKNLNEVYLNGDTKNRIAHSLNVSFGGIKGIDLIAKLKNLAVSSRSACTSGVIEPSHVLKTLGVTDALALSSIRFSLGNFTTKKEIDYAIEQITTAIIHLRKQP